MAAARAMESDETTTHCPPTAQLMWTGIARGLVDKADALPAGVRTVPVKGAACTAHWTSIGMSNDVPLTIRCGWRTALAPSTGVWAECRYGAGHRTRGTGGGVVCSPYCGSSGRSRGPRDHHSAHPARRRLGPRARLAARARHDRIGVRPRATRGERSASSTRTRIDALIPRVRPSVIKPCSAPPRLPSSPSTACAHFPERPPPRSRHATP
jgi:hypothetical protein